MIVTKNIQLLIWIISLQIIGLSIGSLSNGSTDLWYLTLSKSSLTPPGYIFPIAWTLLYLMIAISGWLIWQQSQRLSLDKSLFIIQLIFNWLWTPLFFYLHLPFYALVCIFIIIMSTAMLIIKQLQSSRLVALLLLPYLLWSLFAFYLNLYICLYN